MTTALTLLLVLAAVLAVALLTLAVGRLVAGDGTLDVLGHLRRPSSDALPRSHRDPFEPRTWGHAH